MTVYIVSHKEFDAPLAIPSSYTYLFVGKNGSRLATQYEGICDATGDNIANLNESFCELTAMYWIWKNSSSNIKGMVHYRRFFVDTANKNAAIDEADVARLLNNFDFIVPEKYWIMKSVEEDYSFHHSIDDLFALRSVIAENDSGYVDAFDECLARHYLYPYNMFISSSNGFDSYCEWLFPILFSLYEKIDIEKRDSYQKRVIGFLAERLFSVFLLHNEKAIFECPVVAPRQGTKSRAVMELAKLRYGHREG